MHIQIKLFASLTKYADGGYSTPPLEIDLPENTTLKGLVNILKIPEEETHITFVNGRIEGLDYTLQPDDRVGIFPPIAGGD